MSRFELHGEDWKPLLPRDPETWTAFECRQVEQFAKTLGDAKEARERDAALVLELEKYILANCAYEKNQTLVSLLQRAYAALKERR